MPDAFLPNEANFSRCLCFCISSICRELRREMRHFIDWLCLFQNGFVCSRDSGVGVTFGGMKTGTWTRVLRVGMLTVLAALLVASFLLVQTLEWQGNARWQLMEESIGAFLAFEVAVFALLHYG